MYEHGFGTHFLAAAHGKVGDRKRAGKLDEVLRRAVKLTLASQNGDRAWRYTPTSRDSDLTVTAVQVCALRAARDAGVGVPRKALDGAASYVKKCQDAGGGFHYMTRHGPGAKPSWSRTGAGLLALYCAGVTRGAEVERAQKFLLDHLPGLRAARPDMHYYYGHYHAGLATWATGGDVRTKWYAASRDELVRRQHRDGSWKDLIGQHGATAMALVALQAPGGLLSPAF
jgi:hypothetical protein